MSVFDPHAFGERVSYARRSLLTGRTNGRCFLACFEQPDAAWVLVRLLQRAESDLKLAMALCRFGANETSQRLYWAVRRLSAQQVGRLAALTRAGELNPCAFDALAPAEVPIDDDDHCLWGVFTGDVQEAAKELIGRRLTKEELGRFRRDFYVPYWNEAIESDVLRLQV